jgi:nucleotide-binding universal stress UspA family protein
MSHIEPLFPLEYTRILLPVDCTPASRDTVRQAARFVMSVTGAAITLVANVPPTVGDDTAARHLRAEREAHAEQALETARVILLQCGIYSRKRWQEAPGLREAAEVEQAERPYDLIVAGNCEQAPRGSLPVLILPRIR